MQICRFRLPWKHGRVGSKCPPYENQVWRNIRPCFFCQTELTREADNPEMIVVEAVQ